MRQVQEALKNIGIPVIAGIWRATSENQNPPLQYVVYSSTTTETAFLRCDYYRSSCERTLVWSRLA